jgi:23S rRNA (cytosine1962-C5)-methyltransferase
MTYALIDSGKNRKLERFGEYLVDRPCGHAVWEKYLSKEEWEEADARLVREGDTHWKREASVKETWEISIDGVIMKISCTDFGHLGVFPEHATLWPQLRTIISDAVAKRKEPVNILNLFAYSGGATIMAAQEGAHVCHVDASKGMVAWARDNAGRNKLSKAPIRWIVDDVRKFMKRELRRGKSYDAIILDPPSFGRGRQGEVFKIEEDLKNIMALCRDLMSENPLFMLLSCHTPGYTPQVLKNIATQTMQKKVGKVEGDEMKIYPEKEGYPLPSGGYALWRHDV